MDKIIFIICLIIVFLYTFIGVYKVYHLQNVCTEKINSNDLVLKKYNSFGFIYYLVTANFKYNDKAYTIKRALFENVNENLSEITININPNNPNECYLKNIKDRKCAYFMLIVILFVVLAGIFLL